MKLLVVDDHAIVLAGFARLLQVRPDTAVVYARSGQEALRLIQADCPDLMLLDLNLPDISGLSLLKRIHRMARTVRILVVTMHADLHAVDHALKAGAAGYITKNAAPDELLAAIDMVHRGDRYLEPGISQALALRYVDRDAARTELTLRETEIIRLLAAGNSLRDIAQLIGVSYKTIANNCSLIKLKLGIRSMPDLLRYAIETNGKQEQPKLAFRP